MKNYLITAIILCFYLRTALTEPDLQQQNAIQDHLNPQNDHENADTSTKDQNKRTILNNANYGWAKHVGIKPTGEKYVLGYSPVDLKYSPVIRPLSIKHPGYVYGRPKVHFHVKRPVVQLRPAKPIVPTVWKHAVPVKPLVPANIPHHHHLVTKPEGVAHVDHVHEVQVSHVDHVHNVPVHVDHVHPAPIQPVHLHPAPVHHVHEHPAPVQPVHIHPAPVQPVHIHPAPVQPVHAHPVALQPLAPVRPVAIPQPPFPAQSLVPLHPPPQFIPSQLFEVTKPNLGVLPLGATFASPVLRNIPYGHAVVPFHLKQSFNPQPVLPAPVPLPQPVPVPRPALIPQPVAPQSPQPPQYPPGTVVEYHGSTNFLNHIPLPQIPVNAVQTVFPPHFHLQYPQIPQHQIPLQPAPAPHEQHDVQTPIIPSNQQHFIQQQPPLDIPSHFQPEQVNNNNVFQQQLPANTQTHFQPDPNDQQFVQPDSGPRYQPADQVSTQQFFQGSLGPQQGNFEQLDNQDGGYIYQQPDVPFEQQSIQPGETDLQLPVQLPQHPGFIQNSRQYPQNDAQESQLQSVFRPSIQLEPPYKK